MKQFERDSVVRELSQDHDTATVMERLLGGSNNSTHYSSPNEFDPIVFWSVNAIWMTAVATLIIFFWKCNGAERLQRWMSNGGESDRIYARSIHRRRERQREAKKMSPAQRRSFLERSFQRNKIHMIVEEGDIVREESLDGSHKGNLENHNRVEVDVAVSLDNSHKGDLEIGNNGSIDESNKSDPKKFAVDTINKADIEDGSKTNDGYAQGVDIETGAIETAVAVGETGPPSLGFSTGFDTGMLRLRGENVEQGRKVPNCCAVCLGPYEVGDAVVWSSNPCCSHAFHEECLVDWLIKMQDGTPCPCCRSDFLPDVEKDIKEMKRERRIRWSHQSAMNVNAVRL